MGQTYNVADFETIVNQPTTAVWLWGVVTSKNVFNYGRTIDDFISYISLNPGVYYFHNLKFDIQFIIYWLEKHGYKHTTDNKISIEEYNATISDMGQFYKVRVVFSNGAKVIFKDSLKIIPLPVRDMPKAFGLPIEKLEMNYESIEDLEHIPTEEEIKYVEHDCRVVKMSIDYMMREGMTKLTTASNALSNYKNLIDTEGLSFRGLFPSLTNEVDCDIRKAYKGGWVYVNPLYQDIICGSGMVYDVNSMYPWVMSECLLPYSEPKSFREEPEELKDYPLWVAGLTCEFRLKLGMYPSIQLKNTMRYNDTEYLYESDGPTPLNITCVDWKLIKDTYDVWNIEWSGGYYFKGSTNLFKGYIEKWYGVKKRATEESNYALRTIAKLMLNSLYGKFGTSLIRKCKVPVYDKEKDIIKYVLGEPQQTEGIYVPVACFITSYARDKIIRGALAAGESFAYADTDSLHIIGNKHPAMEIDPYKLGAFKHENDFTQAKYHRSKAYIEVIDGKEEKKCAGLPVVAREKLTIETLRSNEVFEGKLLFKVIPGGATLVKTTYTIK